ncbi:MAG: hypothetical protein AAF479_15615 [Pseudomonadota bacterium]
MTLTLADAARLVRDTPALRQDPDVLAGLKRLETLLGGEETTDQMLARMAGE